MTLALDPRDVHLWWVRPERVADSALLAAYERLLAPEERARRERLRRPEMRHDFLVTRALARATLSRYVAVPPRAWRFRTGRHGRPEIASPRVPLRFNLSHTGGLVACAVARDAVGVDVEDTSRRSRTDALAARYFAPAEVAALGALAPAARRRRFFELWTLKESYVKARGLGLRLPLARFAFHVGRRGRVRVVFDLRDDPRAWRFALLRPTARHVLAVSVRRPHGVAVRLSARETVPLA